MWRLKIARNNWKLPSPGVRVAQLTHEPRPFGERRKQRKPRPCSPEAPRTPEAVRATLLSFRAVCPEWGAAPGHPPTPRGSWSPWPGSRCGSGGPALLAPGCVAWLGSHSGARAGQSRTQGPDRLCSEATLSPIGQRRLRPQGSKNAALQLPVGGAQASGDPTHPVLGPPGPCSPSGSGSIHQAQAAGGGSRDQSSSSRGAAPPPGEVSRGSGGRGTRREAAVRVAGTRARGRASGRVRSSPTPARPPA